MTIYLGPTIRSENINGRLTTCPTRFRRVIEMVLCITANGAATGPHNGAADFFDRETDAETPAGGARDVFFEESSAKIAGAPAEQFGRGLNPEFDPTDLKAADEVSEEEATNRIKAF